MFHPLPTPIYTPSWGDTPARVLRQSNVEHAPNKTMMAEKMDKFQFSLAFPFLKFQYLKLQKKFLDPKKYFLGPHVIISMWQIFCKGVCWCHVKMDHAIHSILTRKKNQTSDLEKMIGQKVSNSVPFVLSYSWVARIVLHQVQLLVQYQSQAEVEGHEGHCCSLISWVALLLLYLYHQGLCHGNSPNPQPLHQRKRSRITQDKDFIKPVYCLLTSADETPTANYLGFTFQTQLPVTPLAAD